MSEFKPYRRKQIAELRPVTDKDIAIFIAVGKISFSDDPTVGLKGGCEVSISKEDLKNGSPKIGDMIARNPKNPLDQWLVAKQYFEDNFEELD